MKSNWKLLALMALLSSVVTLAAYNLLGFNNRDVIFNESAPTPTITGRLAALTGNGPTVAPGDFSTAAEAVTPTVVHIRTTITRTVRQQQVPDIFRDFFGDEFGQGQGQGRPRRQQGQASGSGVIISKDGYIVTNNHVVQDADEVEVIMTDKRSLKAKVIGTDPLTDLAVIKVEANNLPSIILGDSDALRLGEWVLAVGYPLDLESTVTAGIVSAKGRRIGILEEDFAQRQGLQQQQSGSDKQASDNPIESFIQTDAAINPGNSGGALVNLRGELIGINSAIASRTGFYSGYGFAVPVSLVKKVSADLLKYGTVQRGYLGILPIELNSTVAKEKNVKVGRGIYVQEVTANGAAKTAGLQPGDVIVKMEGQLLDSQAQMREIIGRRRPGDAVTVTVDRNGTERDFKVELRNRNGGRDVIKKTEVAAANTSLSTLGAEFEELSAQDAKQLGVSGGVRVRKIMDGKLAETDVEEGFIIVKANGKNVKSTKDLQAIMSAVKEGEGLMLIGMYPNSSRMYYYAVPV